MCLVCCCSLSLSVYLSQIVVPDGDYKKLHALYKEFGAVTAWALATVKESDEKLGVQDTNAAGIRNSRREIVMKPLGRSMQDEA